MRSVIMILALCAVMSLSVCSRGRDRCSGMYETDHGYMMMGDGGDCCGERPVVVRRDCCDDSYRHGAFGFHRGYYDASREDDGRHHRHGRAQYRGRDDLNCYGYPRRAWRGDYDGTVSERYAPPVHPGSVNYEE